MYYVPSAPILKTPQTPSLLRVYGYGAFLCDRTHSLLSHCTATSYLANIPPRLMVAALSESDECVAQTLVGVDSYDKLLETPYRLLSSPAGGDRYLTPLTSWGSLCIKSGDDSLLVRMGLVPSRSQDSFAEATSDEDLEIEVLRNTSFDATQWRETSLQAHDEEFQDVASDDSPRSEPRLVAQTWPSCAFSFSQSIPSMPQTLLGGMSFFASSSSFEEILASSSSPNISGEKMTVLDSDATSLVPLSIQNPPAARSDHPPTSSHIERGQLTVAQDLNYNISLGFTSEFPPDVQFSSELDFPLLPSPSDAAEFIAESFAPLPNAYLHKTKEKISKSISPGFGSSHNPEEGLFSGSLRTSVISLASSSSAQSFLMPSFSSMESLIHASLDIPDLSVGSSFPSICSLCQLPSCASIDDLARVQPPAWCEGDDDDDAFEPLPANIASPFHLPGLLDTFKNFMDLEYSPRSLPCLKEEDP